MPTVQIGRVRPVPKGAHNQAESYQILDVVADSGNSYMAIDVVPNNTLITDTNYWMILAEKGDQGDAGPAGGQGESYPESFETVSKNLQAYPMTLNYSGSQLASVDYDTGVGTITKTLNFSGSQLTSIVLSGDAPNGIDLTKTLTYNGSQLTSIAYS
jgi:hypothetical protein